MAIFPRAQGSDNAALFFILEPPVPLASGSLS
jgi:hypothetical protein